MENINFVIGGRTGDLIHCLYAVKEITKKQNKKANLYITDNTSLGGDLFHHPIDKTFADLYPIIISQKYINSFNILTENLDQYINLNFWRRSPDFFKKNWINILSNLYDIPFNNENWISYKKNKNFEDKILIHRSTWRFSEKFPWENIVKKNNCVFITTDINEYNLFTYRNNVDLHYCETFSDLVECINSCKFFIGNMSTPLALSHGLGVPRLAELYIGDQVHYIGEEKILNNYFYFTDNLENNINGIDKFINL